MPADWLKFFKLSYTIRGYAVVSYSKRDYLNALLEKMFMKTEVKRFSYLENAIEWAKTLSDNKMKVI